MSEYTREEILKMIEENGGPENLDLSGKDLSDIDLSKEAIAKELEKYRKNNPDKTPPWFSQEWWGIDLHGAILKETNLSRAHLESAILERAHLEGAILYKAHWEGAILEGAHWSGADLSEAHLEGAFLVEAHWEGAYLWGVHLEEAFLAEAHLERVYLQDAHLEGAYLWGVHLEGARLVGAHLEKVDLSLAASLAGAYFYGAWLDQTRMTKDQLSGGIGEEIDKEYHKAKEAYLLLKNNFNQIGRSDDASWAYRKERQMEKMTYHPKLAREYYAKIEALPEGASRKSWTWWRFYVKYTLEMALGLDYRMVVRIWREATECLWRGLGGPYYLPIPLLPNWLGPHERTSSSTARLLLLQPLFLRHYGAPYPTSHVLGRSTLYRPRVSLRHRASSPPHVHRGPSHQPLMKTLAWPWISNPGPVEEVGNTYGQTRGYPLGTPRAEI